MQRRRQGFGTTLLMMVPMLGVPALAIFGIPQFAPFLSSQASHADDIDIPELNEQRLGMSATGSQRKVDVGSVESLDIFRPYGETSNSPAETDDAFALTRSWSDPLGRQQVVATRNDSSAPQRRDSVKASRQMHQQVYDIFSDDFGKGTSSEPTPVAMPTAARPVRNINVSASQAAPISTASSTESLTWRHVIERLNAVGPTTYRISAGSQADDYLFVCFVPSLDDSRITRRFEAESKDPLNAVEKVLHQIEQWQRHR